MYIASVCIRRPVFAMVINFIVILLGIMGYTRMQVRLMPKIDFPVISVFANYEGASAKYMESNITKPIEETIKRLKNVEYTRSRSSNSATSVDIFFKPEADLGEAITDIKSFVSDLTYIFPKDMRLPVVSKASSDSMAWMWMLFSSSTINNVEATDILEKRIEPILNGLSSIGGINSVGTQSLFISIEPMLEKMSGYGIMPGDIEKAILSQNTDFPAGTLETKYNNFVMQTQNQLQSLEDIGGVILGNGDKMLRLDQVANIKIKPTNQYVVIRYDGINSTGMALLGQSESNPIEMSDQVYSVLPKIQQEVETLGGEVSVAYDGAVVLKQSVMGVLQAVIEAIILVGLVTFIFLGSLRASIVPLVAIPISIIGAFAFMKVCGFSINMFTMLALVLAIGLVVDDAIVMLENIYSNCEKGMSGFDAANKSVNEISYAILVMTLTLAAVFLPVGFVKGGIGKFMSEFAWSLAFAVLISGFVSLTLSPMIAARVVKHEVKKSAWLSKIDYSLNLVRNKYLYILDAILAKHKLKFAAGLLLSIASIVGLFAAANKTLAPVEDDGLVFINFRSADGAPMELIDAKMIEAHSIIVQDTDVGHFLSNANAGHGFGIVMLKEWSKRSRSQQEIKFDLDRKLSTLQGISCNVFDPPSMASSGSKADVDFNIQGIGGDIYDIKPVAESIVEALRASDMFINIDLNLRTAIPLINLDINKEKASFYHVATESIGSSLQYLFSGKKITDLIFKGTTYPVNIQLLNTQRSSISDLSRVYIRPQNDISGSNMIPVVNFLDAKPTVGIGSFNHYNGNPSIDISGNLKPGIQLSQAVDLINKTAQEKLDHRKMKIEFLGNIKQMAESNASILLAFGLGLIFIYLVLSAQFESFKDSAMILLTVPFSILGGIMFLVLFKNSLNIYSGIGMITLVGLVTKNAIMIIDYTKRQIEDGMEMYSALLESCKARFRPIIMTNAATIVGAMPLVLAHGAGAQARISIGLVISGGLLIGTIFSLFVVPYTYYLTHK